MRWELHQKIQILQEVQRLPRSVSWVERDVVKHRNLPELNGIQFQTLNKRLLRFLVKRYNVLADDYVITSFQSVTEYLDHMIPVFQTDFMDGSEESIRILESQWVEKLWCWILECAVLVSDITDITDKDLEAVQQLNPHPWELNYGYRWWEPAWEIQNSKKALSLRIVASPTSPQHVTRGSRNFPSLWETWKGYFDPCAFVIETFNPGVAYSFRKSPLQVPKSHLKKSQ